MNIIDKLNNYKEVAEYLGDTAIIPVLNSIAQCMEQKNYLLPFIGQFSAGKSRLINRIIGKDVLPTKSVETTAFLTYISYSETERAVLEYANGTTEEIEITEIRKLDHSAVSGGKPIAALRYYTPIELLKSGLTIVDTPGVNTLVSEHVRMTEELLQNSQFIIYVVASSFTATDLQMIRKIEDLGIETIYARTHMDELKAEEENANETITKEIKTIQDFLGKQILYYSLCNEPSSPSFQDWEYQFRIFAEYISHGISLMVEKVYTDSTQKRLAILKDKYESALNSRIDLLQKSSTKSANEIQQTIAKLEEYKKVIANNLDDNTNREQQCAEKIKSQAVKDIKDEQKFQIENFDKELAQATPQNCQTVVKEIYKSSLSAAIGKINSCAEQAVKSWKSDLISNAQSSMKDINSGLGEIDLNIDISFDESAVSEYENKLESVQTEIAEKLYQLKQINNMSDSEIAKLKLDRQNIEEAIAQYNELVSQGNAEVQQMINSFEPRYEVKGGNLGKTLSVIGEIADWATLLIPAAGWKKAGTFLATKAGTIAKTGGKLAQTGAKILTTLSKGAKAMSKADLALDTAKVLGHLKDKVEGKVSNAPKKEGGFLDHFSLSYWFGKVGDMIDPEVVVEDTEYRKQYDAYVRHKEQEIQATVRQKIALEMKIREIKTAEEKARLELEFRAKAEQEMQLQLAAKEKELAAKRDEAIRKSILASAKQQFTAKLEDYVSTVTGRCLEQIDKTCASVCESLAMSVNDKLADVESQLMETKEKLSTTANYLETKKAEINSKIEKLALGDE